jgi:hypothetical protein
MTISQIVILSYANSILPTEWYIEFDEQGKITIL